MWVSSSEFEKLVGEALDGLPAELAEAVENVSVTIEVEPSAEELEAVGLDPRQDTLFGLYQGVTLPERGLGYTSLPDRIVVYRLPILEACDSREQIVEEVRLTVRHELGHYFGLDEDELPP
jgi:predicted Zn-dependent protease with MMP-like domain